MIEVSLTLHAQKNEIHINDILGLDGVCGARDGLKGSKGEPGFPGEAG